MSDMTFPQRIPAGQPLMMFNKALQHGWFHTLWAKLTRKCFCLIDLNEMLKTSPVESTHYAGIKTIPIGRIRGTQGKADEFDAEFNPTQERSRSRWVGVAFEKLKGRDLPPVELVLVNGVYYVRDGHHRISVSRALGQDFIDAEVTVLNLRQHHMTWQSTANENQPPESFVPLGGSLFSATVFRTAPTACARRYPSKSGYPPERGNRIS